jgi:CRISPR-associated protein Cmr2
MGYDFYAEFYARDKEKIEAKIREFSGKRAQRGEWMEQNLCRFFREKLIAKNWYTIIKEISLFEKYYEGSNGDSKEDVKAGYKGFIRDIDVYSIDNSENLEKWAIFKEIKEPKIEVRSFSDHSIFIKVNFSLKKPYISRDDEDFYIVDNPICKDKVFKVPLVRASSWKGALRYAAIKEVFNDFDGLSDEVKIKRRLILFRLFGDEKEGVKDFLDELFGENLKNRFEEELRRYYKKRKDQEINVRGRLVFYPTFLDKIGLDIIAPHDRETRTVKVPIQFEVVPENAEGTFSLLYFPFDLVGEEGVNVKEEIKEDWEILKEAIPAMLTKYGFGAKTTAGYGVAEVKKIEVNGKDCGNDWNKFLEVIN